MTSGLALVAREQRDRLLTVRGMIQDALRTDGLKHDPFTTKLSLAAEHVAKAIEVLQQQTGASAPARR